MGETANLEIVPLTPERWADFETLFGPRGACAGCWCAFWRIPTRDFQQGNGEGNRAFIHGLVEEGRQPGLLAYLDGRPVGWVSLGPREEFVRLQRSRVLKPVDDQPVWSVVCFFIEKKTRGQGLMVELLREAAHYAAQHGATVLEGYPVAPAGRYPDAYAYTGTLSAFQKAGFVEVKRWSEKRPIMRLVLKNLD